MLKDTFTRGPIIKISDDGILYHYDDIRNKNLSLCKSLYTFGIDHRDISCSRYMSTTGKVRSYNAGYVIPRNSTIISAVVTSTVNAECTFYILNEEVTIGTLLLENQTVQYNNDLNIDIDQEARLHILIVPVSGVISYPTMVLETKWRI